MYLPSILCLLLFWCFSSVDGHIQIHDLWYKLGSSVGSSKFQHNYNCDSGLLTIVLCSLQMLWYVFNVSRWIVWSSMGYWCLSPKLLHHPFDYCLGDVQIWLERAERASAMVQAWNALLWCSHLRVMHPHIKQTSTLFALSSALMPRLSWFLCTKHSWGRTLC